MCYPDIELIPTIAGFFAVSVDQLMGVDEAVEKQAVDRYLFEFQKAISHGAVDECIRIAREGVAEFPNNYAMLNSLMYALFVAGSDDADIPNWNENREKYDAEIVALGERAIWWALEEEEKLPHTRAFIEDAYVQLSIALNRLRHLLSPEEALLVLDKDEALENLMYDNNPLFGTWSNTDNHFLRAKYLLQPGREAEAFEQLRIAAEAAIAYDNRPAEENRVSLLLGERTYKRVNCDTADSRPLREIFRDTWLAEEAFDAVRDCKEFKEILEILA